jgi:hypothetical protein
MSNLHPRLLAISMVLAGLTLAGCNNRQYENQPEEISTAPVEPMEPMGEMEPVVEPAEPTMQPDAALVIVDVMRAPQDWVGKTVSGTATVPEVPTDRGFWLEADGQRIFAILNDDPQEEPIDINPGQTLRIKEATVRDATFLTSITGEPLEEETRQLAQSQPVYLVVDEGNIEITSQGEMTPQGDQPMDEGMEGDQPMGEEPEMEEEREVPNPIQ